jgi:hypothetical protein
MKFIEASQGMEVNKFYMNYIQEESSIIAYYVTDELFTGHETDEPHYVIKPLYNCKELVAMELQYAPEDVNADFLFELTEDEGLLIGDMFT